MPKLDFDYVEDLKTAGASQELAQAILRVVSEKQVAQLATKADVAELRTELVETRETLRAEMTALRANMATKDELAETRNELAETRETLRAEMAALRANMATKDELAETRETLRAEMAALRANMATKDELAETRNELAETRETLRAEMAALELRLTEKISAMFTKVIVWLVGTAIASVSLMAAIGQLLK